MGGGECQGYLCESGSKLPHSIEPRRRLVGLRQQGRERARNVIDAAPEVRAILKAIATAKSADFRRSLQGMTNPYGEGVASEKIVEVLTRVPLGEELLLKRHAPIRALSSSAS
ncbi:MAG TPA: UDP-N-acetylglucosamine 2-epimerase [Candidatus Acidoferrales bacterium]|nr:UDP-N-acetylglucosamine 2-epimerase [Candidatus Acidoferrales bacterium]